MELDTLLIYITDWYLIRILIFYFFSTLQSYTKNDMQQVFWQKNCQYLTFVKCFLHISCNTIRFCRVIFFVSLNDS